MTDIGIYQVVLSDRVVPYLDPSFTPLDWRHNPCPQLREVIIHDHMVMSGRTKRHSLTGVLSAKFFVKTSLRFHDVEKWIFDNPGYDIYFISGHPYLTYSAFNSIDLSKAFQRSDFDIITQQVCRHLNVRAYEKPERQTNKNFAYCNYFFATDAVWRDLHSNIINPLLSKSLLGSDLYGVLHSPAGYVAAAPPVYIAPFIYEKLVSPYIAQTSFKAKYYEWTKESIVNLCISDSMREYLERVIPVIDDLDARMAWTDENRGFPLREFISLRSKEKARPFDNVSSDDFNIPNTAV